MQVFDCHLIADAVGLKYIHLPTLSDYLAYYNGLEASLRTKVNDLLLWPNQVGDEGQHLGLPGTSL